MGDAKYVVVGDYAVEMVQSEEAVEYAHDVDDEDDALAQLERQ